MASLQTDWQNVLAFSQQLQIIRQGVAQAVTNLTTLQSKLRDLAAQATTALPGIEADITAGLASTTPGIPQLAGTISGGVNVTQADMMATTAAIAAMIAAAGPALPDA